MDGAARFAVGALALAGASWAVRAIWEIRLAVAGEPASGPPDQGNGAHRTLTGLENQYHLVVSACGVAVVICAVAFIGWLGRARDTARELSGKRPRYSGLWVYLGWVVPVVNLWFPRGIVAEVHRDSAPGERLPRSVNVWWALWLIGLLSGVGLMSADSTDQIIARAYTNVGTLLVSDAAIVGAAVAGVFVVRALSRNVSSRRSG
ncbi:DUF4328 domain-containing protein [Streptomyces sp. CME 23]|nr:DUF4328 domain-containing protein [Streptomyces sp. CME 23]MCH5672472.1 DUF4328 domain-containing protein [Streptomyces sp. CME 23]